MQGSQPPCVSLSQLFDNVLFPEEGVEATLRRRCLIGRRTNSDEQEGAGVAGGVIEGARWGGEADGGNKASKDQLPANSKDTPTICKGGRPRTGASQQRTTVQSSQVRRDEGKRPGSLQRALPGLWTHPGAAEKLKEREGYEVNHETLRRWLLAAGLWQEQRNRPKHRQRREPTMEEQLRGELPLTQFGRACKKLEIEILPAISPQAKRRVENKHGVYQTDG